MKISSRYIDRSIGIIDAATVIGTLGILVVGLLMIARYPPLVWVDLLVDDAYYYLGIVRNLATHGTSSFLPPFDTNGYQPLWTVVLTASAFVFGTTSKSLVAQAYILSFAFLLLFCVTSKLRYGAAFPALVSSAYFFHVVAVGMETTMVPFLFVLYLSTRNWTARGALGSALFLSRLDALSVVLVCDLLDLIRERRIDLRKYAIIVPVAVAYVAINLYFFHTPLPISGLAKSIGNVRGENLATGLNFIVVAQCTVPLLLGVLAYVALVRRPICLTYDHEIAVTVLCTLLCASYYAINSGWKVWGWYYWPVFMFTYYLTLEAVALVKSRATPDKALSLAHFAVLVLVLLFVAKPALGLPYRRIIALTQSVKDPQDHPTYGRRNVELVSWLHKENVKPGAFFAMGDRAGSFGFFLGDDYRFLHTEGLVGPYSYYLAMRNDRGGDFVDRLGLDYLVVDRGHMMSSDGTIGVIEPVQPLSARYGDYLLCFRKDGILLDQSYYWDNALQRRYLLDFRSRIPCPAAFESRFQSLRMEYAGVVKFSFPDEIR